MRGQACTSQLTGGTDIPGLKLTEEQKGVNTMVSMKPDPEPKNFVKVKLFRRSWVRAPMRSLIFFNLPNPCSLTMAMEFTQTLIEMNTRELPGGKEQPARKVDSLTAICEPTILKTWNPRRLTTL
jgi:hypothetical protein